MNKSSEMILAAITSKIRNDDISILISDTYVTNSLRIQSEVRCHTRKKQGSTFNNLYLH
ncbi:MAG: hypothetical protein H0V65_06545 [Chitinophagales bacterium]|nr:hypothetical protein [Chitinophagales bacterium]